MKSGFFRAICIVTLMAFGTTQLSGCVAGDFGLTREVGNWNRSFSIIPRVLIYIVLVIIPVYELTLLFDFLLNNTIQFWTGSALVSQNQTFEKDGLRVVINNTRDPLRKTVITVYEKSGAVKSVSELRETETGSVEVYVNNVKKAEVNSIGDALVELTTLDGSRHRYISTADGRFDRDEVRAALVPVPMRR